MQERVPGKQASRSVREHILNTKQQNLLLKFLQALQLAFTADCTAQRLEGCVLVLSSRQKKGQPENETDNKLIPKVAKDLRPEKESEMVTAANPGFTKC